MQKYTAYRVGEVFDKNMPPWEGATYNFVGGMHIILLSFHHIQRHEQRAIESGLWRFGLYVEEEVIYLLFKADAPFQQPGILWHAMPFHWHKITSPQPLPIPAAEIPDPLGILITVLLLDATSRRIIALNTKNASHDFSQKLHEAIHRQAQMPFDLETFERHVAVIDQRYSPEGLANAAQTKCIGGINEAG